MLIKLFYRSLVKPHTIKCELWYVHQAFILKNATIKINTALPELITPHLPEGHSIHLGWRRSTNMTDNKWAKFTCKPVATASTLSQSHVCLSEITPTLTRKAMNTACLSRREREKNSWWKSILNTNRQHRNLFANYCACLKPTLLCKRLLHMQLRKSFHMVGIDGMSNPGLFNTHPDMGGYLLKW